MPVESYMLRNYSYYSAVTVITCYSICIDPTLPTVSVVTLIIRGTHTLDFCNHIFVGSEVFINQ